MSFCTCSLVGLNGNTGINDNAKTFGETKAILVMRRKAKDGTPNQITSADLVAGKLPQSFLDEKLHHVDPTKRWYLLKFETVESVRDAPNTSQQGVGVNRILSQGNRPFRGTMYKPQETYHRNLAKLGKCSANLGFMKIDACGSLGGELKEGSTVLKPIPIGQNTWYIDSPSGTEAEDPLITVDFQYDRLFQDANFDMIPNESITDESGYLLSEAMGLQNVYVGFTVTSATEATLIFNLESGNFPNSAGVPGIDASDIELSNKTASTTVSLTSLTPTSTDGVYTAVFPSQTAGDVLTPVQTASGTNPNVYAKELLEFQKDVTDVAQ